MADRQVTGSGKDSDGDITSLCNWAVWGNASKADAISHIENRIHTYYVQQPGTSRADVEVVTRNGRKHLQTTPDSSSANNLDNIPNC